MQTAAALIEARRAAVVASYTAMEADNRRRWLEGDVYATEEYVFPNQKADAQTIVEMFDESGVRCVTILKKTQVGMRGLMIELAYQMCLQRGVRADAVYMITGMANVDWQAQMRDTTPECFRAGVVHHGQLPKLVDRLRACEDGLVIIDESQLGTREHQRMHSVLADAGLLDMAVLERQRIWLVCTSATPLKTLYDTSQWGPRHAVYRMTIPATYVGHHTFLEMGIVREFQDLKKPENARAWLDVIWREYGREDPRVHIVRGSERELVGIRRLCEEYGFGYQDHTASDRLSEADKDALFVRPLDRHQIIGVKDLLRAANSLPSSWKPRIGSLYERYKATPDDDVQVQGLVGRMTGYWRPGDQRIGPYYTSLASIRRYLAWYDAPDAATAYRTAHFARSETGRITKRVPSLLAPQHVAGVEPVPEPETAVDTTNRWSDVFRTRDEALAFLHRHCRITDREGHVRQGEGAMRVMQRPGGIFVKYEKVLIPVPPVADVVARRVTFPKNQNRAIPAVDETGHVCWLVKIRRDCWAE